MITPVPLPAILNTATRILRSGRQWSWFSSDHPEARIPVFAAVSQDLRVAGVVALRADAAKLFASPGILRVSPEGDESVLLTFCPRALVMAQDPLSGATALPLAAAQDGFPVPQSNELVLVLGVIAAVEVRVPSHAIDVIALVPAVFRTPMLRPGTVHGPN